NWFDGSTYTYLGASGWQTGPAFVESSGLTGIQADVTNVEMVGPCATRVTATASHARRVVYEDPEVPIQSRPLTFLIDWKAVDPVKVRDEFFASRTGHVIYHGYRLDLSNPKTKNSIMFYVEDKTKADRAAFAMSFLQQQCDPAAESGF